MQVRPRVASQAVARYKRDPVPRPSSFRPGLRLSVSQRFRRDDSAARVACPVAGPCDHSPEHRAPPLLDVHAQTLELHAHVKKLSQRHQPDRLESRAAPDRSHAERRTRR